MEWLSTLKQQLFLCFNEQVALYPSPSVDLTIEVSGSSPWAGMHLLAEAHDGSNMIQSKQHEKRKQSINYRTELPNRLIPFPLFVDMKS